MLFAIILMISSLLCGVRGKVLIDSLNCDQDSCADYECVVVEDCPFGFVTQENDPCGCCSHCAKGLGEHCGGLFDYAGVCGASLICIPHPKYQQLHGRCAPVDIDNELF